MSYILDALRRADAERERGAVPSLHAQQYSSLPSDDEPRRGPKPLVWVVIGLSAALIAALAWNFLGRGAPAPAVAMRAPEPSAAPPAAAPAAPPVAVAASAPSAAGPASAAVAAAPVEAPKTVRKPVRRPAPPAAAPGGSPDGARVADGSRPASPPGTASRGNDAPTAGRSPSPGGTRDADPANATRPAEGGDGRVYALRDLPEEIRRTLPNVAVSGSTYSTDRASRMLMINGQIFHEGDVVSNGLVLQQIKPRGAVFSFKGFRYETNF
jgi:general secretion pathway protein B